MEIQGSRVQCTSPKPVVVSIPAPMGKFLNRGTVFANFAVIFSNFATGPPPELVVGRPTWWDFGVGWVEQGERWWEKGFDLLRL